MSQEELPRKRLKVDDGYISSPSSSPIRFGSKAASPAPNAVVLYEPSLIKKDPVSLPELVASRTVMINIGPEQDAVNISTLLFQGISQPLHQMLNSAALADGDVTEINRYLQQDDKDAFLQLVSLAYNQILKSTKDTQLTQTTISNGNGTANALFDIDTLATKAVKCRDCEKGNIWMDVRCDSPKSVCKAPRLEQDYGLQFFLELQLTQSYQVAAYIFSRQFPQVQAPNPIDNATGKPYSLTHFAKVFNLAAKWQVQSLQFTSLLGFQNRLRRYIKAGLNDQTLDELLDTLRYLASTNPITNSITVRHDSDPKVVDSGKVLDNSMLLKGLMRYICVHVSTLLQDLDFRQIVVEHGIIGLMLFEVLSETMAVSKGDD